MQASLSGYVVRLVAGVIAAGFLFATLATAQTPKGPVDLFLENPAQVLSQYPNGGAQLISLIRDVATSHPEALQTIIGLVSNANADQQSAIGSGLGQAYKIVLNTNQTYATQISAAIASTNSDNAKTTYAAVIGDVLIGAAGGAGAGAGGGTGIGGPTGGNGQTGGSNSGTSGSGQSFFQTAAGTFTGGGGGVGGATATGTTTSTVSVSPH